MSKFDWLEKKKNRSVDQLRPWPNNPRLDPEEKHINISDYVSDLIADNSEKSDFFKLIDSIATDGYIPAEPIVVWQDTGNSKYYVAEGNRRILALKLLRNPDKAPKEIRRYVRSKSQMINRDEIEKIKVCVAPSFEDSEWYINQRHSTSSLQRRWSRLQQQRRVAELYDRFNGDVNKIISKTKFSKSELEYILRILHIRDLALSPEVLKTLSSAEKESIKSHRIPMTIFERWFINPIIKEKWGIEFDEDSIRIISNMQSFLNAYAEWIKLVIHRDDSDVTIKINTRTIDTNLNAILACLPEVSFKAGEEALEASQEPKGDDSATQDEAGADDSKDKGGAESGKGTNPTPLNKNPDRNQLVVGSYYLYTPNNYKLDKLFKEFKKIPVYQYNNCVAASLRVFLDLAIAEYFSSEGHEKSLKTELGSNAQFVNLRDRLKYMQSNKILTQKEAANIVKGLLTDKNEHSLKTLNSYVHGDNTHLTSRRFLNGFWDFLFPLFEEIMDIRDS